MGAATQFDNKVPPQVAKLLADAEAGQAKLPKAPDTGAKPDGEHKPAAASSQPDTPPVAASPQPDAAPAQRRSAIQVADMGTSLEPTPAAIPHEPRGDASVPADYLNQLTRLSQQLSTLQGKYDAEVPRLAAQLRERDAEIERLRGQANRIPDTGKPLTEDDLKTQYGFTDEQIEYIDIEQLNASRRIAAVESRHIEDAVRQQVAPVQHELAQERERRFHRELIDAIPDWVELDASDPFNDWVEANGGRWKQKLQTAYKAMKVPDIVDIVDAYRAITGNSARPAATQPSPVAPAPRANVSRPNDSGKQTLTLAELQAKIVEYTKSPNSLRGQFLLKEIESAQAEGRVRPR